MLTYAAIGIAQRMDVYQSYKHANSIQVVPNTENHSVK
jgi:hypothetical protein